MISRAAAAGGTAVPLPSRKRGPRRGHRRHAFDPIHYKRRNVVERCFNRLKHFRGIATRYGRLAAHYRSAVTIACLPLWLR
nr:transposase [Streptosporangium sandarakinum]